MIPGLVLVGVALLGFLVASATTPSSARSRERAAERRRSWVAEDPRRVCAADVMTLLRREGLDPDRARIVVERAEERRVSAYAMWQWLQQFDAETLRVVVTAEMSASEFVTHMGRGTVPNVPELREFAAAHGLTMTGRVVVAQGSMASTRLTAPPLPDVWEPSTGGLGCIEDRRVARADQPADGEGTEGAGGLAA